MERVPSFFLVGAPKAGTTSVAHYLAQHPDVFVPSVKEPHFFLQDPARRHPQVVTIDRAEAYARLFAPWSGQRIIAEASSSYLAHPAAARAS